MKVKQPGTNIMSKIFVLSFLINENEAIAELVIKSAEYRWTFYTYGDVSIFMKILCGTVNTKPLLKSN